MSGLSTIDLRLSQKTEPINQYYGDSYQRETSLLIGRENNETISICSNIRNSKITLAVTLIAAAALAYVSAIPFNETAKEFANGVVPLEYLYITCNMISTGSLMAWGLANLILQTLPTQEGPSKNCFQIFKDTMLLSVIITFAALSRISNIYVAAQYASNIIWPIIVAVAQTGLPVLSLYRLIAAVKSFDWSFGRSETRELDRKVQIQTLIQAKQSIFSKNEAELNRLLLLKGDRASFKRSITEGISNLTEVSRIKKYNQYLFQVVGFSTVVGALIYKGKLSYEFAEKLWQNKFFQITFAALCVGPTSYLSMDITNVNFKILANLLSCNNFAKNIPFAYYPVFTLALKTLSAAIGILTFPSIVTVNRDEFGFDNPFGVFVGGSTLLNNSLLSAYAMCDLIDLLLQPIIERIGNEKAKLAIHLHKAIDQEVALINNEILSPA